MIPISAVHKQANILQCASYCPVLEPTIALLCSGDLGPSWGCIGQRQPAFLFQERHCNNTARIGIILRVYRAVLRRHWTVLELSWATADQRVIAGEALAWAFYRPSWEIILGMF
eukprot:9488332-Pyramimonas_sp.AAC.1